MNNMLETAIKNKIAIEMIEYLGEDSIEDVPYNIEYPATYIELMDENTRKEVIEHASHFDLQSDGYYQQTLGIATMKIFIRYFDEDFTNVTFTIEQFKKALKLLNIDIWDVLEMKYILHM